MGAAPAEHVDVELVGLGQQQVRLVGDEGEALEEADAQGAVGDDLGQRQGGGLDVEATLDDLEVGGDAAEVLVGVLVGQVAEAEGLAYLAWGEEFLELCAPPQRDRLVLSALICSGCAAMVGVELQDERIYLWRDV